MENTPYQKKKDAELTGLNDLLEDIQWRRGQNEEFKPHFGGGKSKVQLNSFLATIQESLSEAEEAENMDDDFGDIDIDDEPETDEIPENDGSTKLFLGPNQRYFMGAGAEPSLVIVTKIDDQRIYYYQHPWKKEQMIRKDAGIELLTTGCKTFLENDPGGDEDLTKSIQAVLNGRPGEKVSLEDYQFSNIQVRYSGSLKGDYEPWKKLEQDYNVNVTSVLNNKQTYNIRMTNRKLEQFQEKLQQANPSEREFKIVKIVKEDNCFYNDILTEAYDPYKINKPRPQRREIQSHEKAYLNQRIADNIDSSEMCFEFQVGQIVIWKDDLWTIGDFVNLDYWTPDETVEKDFDNITAMLYNKERNEIAEFVPLSKIKAASSEDLTKAVGKDEAAKTPQARELKFPTSSAEDNFESHENDKVLSDKPKRTFLVKEELTGVRKNLYNFITERSQDMFGQFLSKDALNHLERRIRFNKPDKYDEEKAMTYFRKVAQRGANKFNRDVNWNEQILEDVAHELKKKFEKDAKNNMIGEEARSEVEKLVLKTESILKLKKEADEDENADDDTEVDDLDLEPSDDLGELDDTDEPEEPEDEFRGEDKALIFTDEEKDAAKPLLPTDADMEKENSIDVGFSVAENDYNIKIMKKKVKGSDTYVYYADATKNGDEVDRTRADKESRPFRGEFDVNALKNFISDLGIGRELSSMNESFSRFKLDGERTQKIVAALTPIIVRELPKIASVYKPSGLSKALASGKGALLGAAKSAFAGAMGLSSTEVGRDSVKKALDKLDARSKKAFEDFEKLISSKLKVSEEADESKIELKKHIVESCMEVAKSTIDFATEAGDMSLLKDSNGISKVLHKALTDDKRVELDMFERMFGKKVKDKEPKEKITEGEVVKQEDIKSRTEEDDYLPSKIEPGVTEVPPAPGVVTDNPNTVEQIPNLTDEQQAIVNRSRFMVNGPLGETVRYWILSQVRGDVETARTLKKAIDTIIRKSKLDEKTVYGAFGDPFNPENANKNWENCKPIWIEKINEQKKAQEEGLTEEADSKKAKKEPAKKDKKKKVGWNGHTTIRYVNAIPPKAKKSRLLPDGTRERLVTFKEKEERENRRRERREKERKKKKATKQTPKNESLIERASNVIMEDILKNSRLKGE